MLRRKQQTGIEWKKSKTYKDKIQAGADKWNELIPRPDT